MPIATFHHRHTVTNQTHSPVAQIVMSPMVFRDCVSAEQRACDFAVARVLQSAIQGTQCQEQAVSSVRWQRSHVRAWRASPSCAPQSQRGRSAMFKQLIERQNDGDRFAARSRYCVGTKISVCMPQHEIRIPDARCEQLRHRRREVIFDKFRRH